MAVGGARGIAVGGAPAAAGGSNPGTSQDQRPCESAIGAAPAGNPRSRRVSGGGGSGGVALAGGGGGGGRRRGAAALPPFYSIACESRRGQGPEIFPPSHFVLFPLFTSADGPGGRKLFGIGFCSFLAVVV
jgi:hypothetical protein